MTVSPFACFRAAHDSHHEAQGTDILKVRIRLVVFVLVIVVVFVVVVFVVVVVVVELNLLFSFVSESSRPEACRAGRSPKGIHCRMAQTARQGRRRAEEAQRETSQAQGT